MYSIARKSFKIETQPTCVFTTNNTLSHIPTHLPISLSMMSAIHRANKIQYHGRWVEQINERIMCCVIV